MRYDLTPLNTVTFGYPTFINQMVTGAGFITCITAANSSITTPFLAALLDGGPQNYDYLAWLAAPAAGSSAVSTGWPGIPFKRGIYLSLSSGSALVTVTYIPEWVPLD